MNDEFILGFLVLRWQLHSPSGIFNKHLEINTCIPSWLWICRPSALKCEGPRERMSESYTEWEIWAYKIKSRGAPWLCLQVIRKELVENVRSKDLEKFSNWNKWSHRMLIAIEWLIRCWDHKLRWALEKRKEIWHNLEVERMKYKRMYSDCIDTFRVIHKVTC